MAAAPRKTHEVTLSPQVSTASNPDLRLEGQGRIEVFGPLRFIVDGRTVAPPRGRPGALLHRLLVQPNTWVDGDELARSIWPGACTETGRQRLQVVVSRLRKHLPPAVELAGSDSGYCIDVTTWAMDVVEFEALARRAQHGDTAAARAALDLWCGQPYAGFPESPALARERRRLHAIRADLDAVAAGPSTTASEDSDLSPGWLPPPLVGEVVRRRLLDRLPRIGTVRLVEVVAPIDHGKTVLLARWARRQGRRVAWVPLTAAHDTPESLHRALLEALEVTIGLTVPEPSGHDGAAATSNLVNALLATSEPVAIVLDDVHVLGKPSVRQQLEDLLRLCPPNVTVVLASRRTLPFSTSRLAAEGQLVRLEADDLAFTVDEVEKLLRRGDHHRASSDAAALHDLTRGWPGPTAVLATTTEPVGCSDDDRLARLEQAGFLEGVLDDLPDDLARFVRTTASLDELDPDLCAAATGEPDALEWLRALEQRRLLDRRDGVARYRHPFADLLARQAGRYGLTPAGHARAARWCLDRRRAVRALHHASAAEDTKLVSRSLESAVRRALATGDGRSLARWAGSVPLGDLQAGTRALPHLAAAFLEPDRRRHWAVDQASCPPVVTSTVHAMDLARSGRCLESLSVVDRARQRQADTSEDLSELIDTLLGVTEAENQLLLGRADDRTDGSLLRRVEATRWPPLILWAYGQGALGAYVSGDVGRAAALLGHARKRTGPLHESWRSLTHGVARVTSTLVDMQLAPNGQGRHTPQEIAARLHGPHPPRPGPMAVLARYALHLAHRQAGDHAAAARALDEADDTGRHLGDLALLTAARERIVEDDDRGTTRLSPREREVFRYLDTDLTLAQIADEMYLSVHTVKTHTRSIYRKLGVHGRAEAVSHELPGTSGSRRPSVGR